MHGATDQHLCPTTRTDISPVTEIAALVYLFLQGPHGPFFHRLALMLRRAGATVWRVGFNAGDSVFWFHRPSYIAFRDPLSQWPGI